MSQNLIEKLQEIWDTARQDPTIRQVRRQWRKIQKSDGYKIAASAVSDLSRFFKKGGRYLLDKGRVYGLIFLNILSSGPLSGNRSPATGEFSDDDKNSVLIHKEYHLSNVQKHLQAAHSLEELEKMCTKLVSTDSIYTRLCAERSQQMGDEILRVAKEVQTEIGGNRGQLRRNILKKRWGNDVPVGLHCLRSALEVVTEAAENTKNPEFIDMFVQKIRAYNPNSYYGLHDVFSKHRNYKKTTRQHNLLQIIREETARNPEDICLIAHKSKGNHTGSGYHMVLHYNDTIISFNGEYIEKAESYFAHRSTQGDLINISRTVREDGKDEIIRQIVEQIKADENKTIQMLLAMYKGDKNIPLQDRMLAGSDTVNPFIQNNMSPVASINPPDNFDHLRKARAKILARQVAADGADVRPADKKTAVRQAKGTRQTQITTYRRNQRD